MESISLFIQAKWQKDTQIQILLFALFSIGSCFLSCHSLMATPMFGKIPIRGFSSKEFNTRYTIALHSTVKSFLHRPCDKPACDLHHAQIKAFY